MLQLNLNGKTYQADRAPLENKLLSLLLSKKAEALAAAGAQANLLTSAVKGTISLILSGMQEQVPEGMDTLDYALGLFVKAGFDALEKQPIDLTLAEVDDSIKSDETYLKQTDPAPEVAGTAGGDDRAIWEQTPSVSEDDGSKRAE